MNELLNYTRGCASSLPLFLLPDSVSLSWIYSIYNQEKGFPPIRVKPGGSPDVGGASQV